MAPLVVHQSDLQSINRCPQEFRLQKTRPGLAQQNSRTAYGSVMHHALRVLTTTRDLRKAQETFAHYWHPLRIEAICDPVSPDGWLGRDTYGGLLNYGHEALAMMWEFVKNDEAELLAVEYDFVVPSPVEGIYLAGQVDRLLVRWRKRLAELTIEDWKAGKQKWGLRWNVQGTVYAWATQQPEFWRSQNIILRRLGEEHDLRYRTEGFGERADELEERFAETPRRFVWIGVKDGKWVDGGYRDQQDWERLRLALEQVRLMDEVGMYPLRLDGETCQYCAFTKSCGDVPVPDEDHGNPWA